jgi:hypothetical protein
MLHGLMMLLQLHRRVTPSGLSNKSIFSFYPLFYIIVSQLPDFTYLYNRLNVGIIFKVIDNCISVLCYRFIIFSNIINVENNL